MKKLLIGFILLSTHLLNAQITEERETQILDAVNGEPLFILLEGQHIFSYEPVSGWYKVRKKVRLKITDVVDKTVMAGVLLLNEKGESIGRTVQELKAKEIKKIEEFRGDGWYEAILEGYLFKTKMQDGSIPEIRLEEILVMKNRNEQANALDDFKRDFNLEERKFGNLTALVLREENKILAEEKDFRLVVVFRNKTMLFAVITNNRTMQLQKVKQEWEEGDFKIQYLSKPSSDQTSEVENILYTFLAL